jgi:hypothetical protein
MSFILDALKKLERQKQTEDGGSGGGTSVIKGGRRWGDRRRRFDFGLGSAIVALTALILAGLALYQSLGPKTQTPVQEAETAPVDPARLPAIGRSVEEPSEPPLVEEPSPQHVAQKASEPEPIGQQDLDETDSVPEEEPETVHPVRLVGRAPEGPTDPGPESESEELSEEIPEGLPELVLQGTSVIEGKPVAVVNYQRLFEGDTIEGARVARISDRVVELEFEGKRFVIKF